jgi:hypothetical protein
MYAAVVLGQISKPKGQIAGMVLTVMVRVTVWHDCSQWSTGLAMANPASMYRRYWGFIL